MVEKGATDRPPDPPVIACCYPWLLVTNPRGEPPRVTFLLPLLLLLCAVYIYLCVLCAVCFRVVLSLLLLYIRVVSGIILYCFVCAVFFFFFCMMVYVQVDRVVYLFLGVFVSLLCCMM